MEAQDVGLASWYEVVRTKEEGLPKEEEKPTSY